jgi:AraC-like DNA-binding protein
MLAVHIFFLTVATALGAGTRFARAQVTCARGQSMPKDERLLYLTHSPCLPLAPFVEHLWLLSDAPSHTLERIFPSGTLELVINLHEDEIRIHNDATAERYVRFSGIVVSGAYGKPFVIDTAEHALAMGVHFRPGGAVSFLGVPADELKDAHVDLRTFWGPEAAELREQICRAPTHAQRFRLLENALLHRAARAPLRHPTVGFAVSALQQPGAHVREIARQVGMSHRRLIDVFAREVGMTPKLFCRVSRFQRLLLMQQRSGGEWAPLALECGYFDQSHLIRDFLAFSGFTPADYRGRAAAERVKDNHVALG